MAAKPIVFDSAFEADVIATALVNAEFALKAQPILDNHNFIVREHKWLWQTALHQARNGEQATVRVVQAKAHKDFSDPEERDEVMTTYVALRRRKPPAKGFALDEVERFARFGVMQTNITRIGQDLDKGDVDAAWGRWRKAAAVEVGKRQHTEVRWMEEFPERQAKRKHRKEHPELYTTVPTRIRTLDEILGGGIQGGELGLVVGTTGRGKSIFSVHLGFAGGVSGNNIVYFTTEMKAAHVATRFDSRFYGLPYKQFKTYNFTTPELDQMERMYRRRLKELRENITIVHIPVRTSTPDMVRRYLKERAALGQKAHMAIVDCGDHLRPTDDNIDDFRLKQSAVFWELKEIAEELDIGVWSTVQANKTAKARIATAEDASESYDKARIADIVVTLNQSKEMKEFNEMSLSLVKYRDGEDQKHIPISTTFALMLCEEKDEFESDARRRGAEPEDED